MPEGWRKKKKESQGENTLEIFEELNSMGEGGTNFGNKPRGTYN